MPAPPGPREKSLPEPRRQKHRTSDAGGKGSNHRRPARRLAGVAGEASERSRGDADAGILTGRRIAFIFEKRRSGPVCACAHARVMGLRLVEKNNYWFSFRSRSLFDG